MPQSHIMGRKTSSAVPPILIVSNPLYPSYRDVTCGSNRAKKELSSAGSEVFFTKASLPSFHLPTALCELIPKLLSSSTLLQWKNYHISAILSIILFEPGAPRRPGWGGACDKSVHLFYKLIHSIPAAKEVRLPGIMKE